MELPRHLGKYGFSRKGPVDKIVELKAICFDVPLSITLSSNFKLI